jgi:hypothetical protein
VLEVIRKTIHGMIQTSLYTASRLKYLQFSDSETLVEETGIKPEMLGPKTSVKIKE